MDYHSLKRKELQALCKEHNIPANSANSVLADKLSALLNEKQKSKTRQRTCMKGSVETTDEGEPAALKRETKKVRFSPNNDLVEYELRSGEKQKDMITQVKTGRKSVAKKVDKPVVDSNITVELVEDTAQIPVRVTRSRVQSSGNDVVPNNEKKQNNRKNKGRREAKDVEQGTDIDKETEGNVGKVTRSKAHTLQKGGGIQREDNKQSRRLVKEVEESAESVEQTVVGRVRVTRSKAQTSMEGGTGRDANPHVEKKTDKQVKTDGQSVEPSKDIMDIPVRATRSTRQMPKEDIGNNVTNPQADKKRTRREMKAADLNSNSSHVAPVDKQEPPKRKSLRTRGVDEHEGDKMEVVDNSRVTRSKAPLVMKDSKRNSKNKAKKVEVEELEEPLKHAAKKNVNRRKSVLQPGKTEVDPHIEVAVNHPARKDTRRKSIMQKATKTVESPTVGIRQSKGLSGNNEDKDNVTRSGKTASENDFEEATTVTPKSRKRRGTPIIEDQIIETEYGSVVDKSPKSSTRSASKSEGKSVAKKEVESSLKKPMSRMSIQSSIEDAPLEVKSSAMRSGATIRESSSKKRVKLSGTKQSDSEDHALYSSKEGTPVAKMRNVKLDEEVTEPEVTPVIDKSDRRSTRSTIKSERKEPSQSARFTRSTIRSERKEPSQSANKEQPIAEAQLFSPKVAKFRPDPAVNTAPGRITRRGIKHGGNAAGSLSEKVGKKKQTRQSAHKKSLDDDQMPSPEVAEVGLNPDVGLIDRSEIKQLLDEVQKSSPEDAEVKSNRGVDTIGVQSEIKQPYDDVQMCSPEVAEVQPNPDSDTVGVGSEFFKEVTGQILGDSSTLESARFSTKVVEEKRVAASGTAINMESSSLVSGENASVEVMEDAGACIEKSTYEASVTQCLTENLLSEKHHNPRELQSFDAGTPLGKNQSQIKMTSVLIEDVAEAVPDAISDVSRVQNQNEEVYVESGIFSEDVNLETSVLKSGRSPVSVGDVQENPFSGNDIDGVCDNPISDQKSRLDMFGTPFIGKGYVRDDDINVSKELETGSELSNANKTLGVPVLDVMEDAGGCTEKSTYEASATECLTENLLSGKHQNPRELQSFDAGTPLGKNQSHIKMTSVSTADVAEAVPDAISDVSRVQNQNEEVYVESGIFSEDVNLETSVLKSGRSPVSVGGDVQENPFSGNDIDGECDNAISDQKSCLDMLGTPLIGKGDVRDDGVNVSKELETGSELSNANKTLDVPVMGIDIDIERVVEDNSDVQNGESEHDQLTSNDNHATDEEDVGCDDSEPAQNENMPVAAEVLVRSHDQKPEQSLNVAVVDVPRDTVGQSDLVTSKDTPNTLATSGIDDVVVRVDAPEESVVDINKDVVSSILGDTYDMDAEGDGENEQKLDEGDKGFQPNKSGGISSDMSNEQKKEEAETSRGYGHTLDDQEQPAATDDDSDSGKFMEDGSHIGVNEVNSEPLGNIKAHEDPAREEALPILNTEGEPTVDGIDSSQLMGDIGAHESPITKESSPITYKNEESPVDDTDSDLPTIKEDDRNKQEEILNASTSVDWGDYDYGMDEFEKPVSANGSADVEGEGKEDDQDSDIQTSARTSYFIEESSGLATGLANSARKLEKDSRNAADGKSNQEVDMLKESANAADLTQEVFNWSGADSSLKSLFATPAATRISHVGDSQEDAAKFANQDTYSSLKSLFATPTTTRISHVKTCQEAADLANQDHYSSLKTLFKTPAVTQISHVNDGRDVKTGQEDAADFANQDHYSSLKPLFKAPAVTQIRHVNDGRDVKSGQEVAVDFANQDHYSSLKSIFKTPAVTQISHVKDGQEDAVGFPNQDHSRADSSLKSLFKTPGVTQTSHVKGGQEDAVSYANQDPYSSLKTLFTTPATTQISNVKDAQGEATNFANKDDYSSLKSLFATPATTRTSHVNDHEADAVNFTFTDRCNEDIGSSRNSAHEFNHQWGNDQSKDIAGETQVNAVRGPENEIHEVPSFGDYSLNLFEDDDVGGSIDRSGSTTHFGYKQFESLNEAAGTSHHNLSGLKDNSTRSCEFEKKEDTLIKGSEVNDDLTFDTVGHMHDYRGDTGYSNK